MRRTDIFVRKPVLAIVVSVFILLFGLHAGTSLSVRHYPRTVNAEIVVSTTYYGADADVVAGFITTPLENAIAQIDGIDYLASHSSNGLSKITLHLRLNQDPDSVLTEVQTQIASVHDQLPGQTPVVELRTAQQGNMLVYAFQSDAMSPEQLTDYLQRVVSPQLESIPGVQQAPVWGSGSFAMRIWLDPPKLAAQGLTAADVSAALAANNFTSGAGATAGVGTQMPLGITTNLHTEKAFERLVVRNRNGEITRLADVARVELGAEGYQQENLFNGKPAVFVDVEANPQANVLDVIHAVQKRFAAITADFPQGLHGYVAYNVADNVEESIREVVKTLVESLVIVTLVVFAFLRSGRASLIPAVTIPLSLIGTLGLIWMFGFSINLLTLLALVLATGLVVDDAIIVVENVAREIGAGVAPLEASIRSGRQLASPILAMTVVLVAAYVPIALRTGLTGALFSEFALTVAGAVTVSAVVALTLSPMMCRFLLTPQPRRSSATVWLQGVYRSLLRAALTARPLILVFGVAVLPASVVFYRGSTSELAPQEDTSFIYGEGSVPAFASIDALRRYEPALTEALQSAPESDRIYEFDSPGDVSFGVALKPWGERHRSTARILDELQARVHDIAGEDIALFQDSALPGADGLSIQYVLKTTHSFSELDQVAESFVHDVMASGKFTYADRDLKVDLPEADIVLDRDKVAALGLDMARLGATVNALLGGGYINYFNLSGHAYKVIPQVERQYRLNPAQLGNYTIATIGGIPVPLFSVATIRQRIVPEQINHFQQMNDAVISAVPASGVSVADALAEMNRIAARVLPPDYSTDATGPLRQYIQESSGFLRTFGIAVVVVYLALAALFGSFRDPLIILVSVPMSLAGALVFIYLGVNGASLNIYTQVGLVTLMGLISKHGILMVEVANEQQMLGRSRRDAIEHAAVLRLRPILMTTAAMVLGVLPLVFATGAGAAARFAMGLVIAGGLSVGTIFTLFVVPAFYLVLARRHGVQDVPAEEAMLRLNPAE